VGRLLLRATGFTFRHWRWGFLLRPAVLSLAASHEQVAQIAYRCGYDSVPQFDRDFRRMLSVTPTEYRELSRVDSQ
jgi:AraC-like DNA-binding protein